MLSLRVTRWIVPSQPSTWRRRKRPRESKKIGRRDGDSSLALPSVCVCGIKTLHQDHSLTSNHCNFRSWPKRSLLQGQESCLLLSQRRDCISQFPSLLPFYLTRAFSPSSSPLYSMIAYSGIVSYGTNITACLFRKHTNTPQRNWFSMFWSFRSFPFVWSCLIIDTSFIFLHDLRHLYFCHLHTCFFIQTFS